MSERENNTIRFGVEIAYADGGLLVNLYGPSILFNSEQAQRISDLIGQEVIASAEREYAERDAERDAAAGLGAA